MNDWDHISFPLCQTIFISEEVDASELQEPEKCPICGSGLSFLLVWKAELFIFNNKSRWEGAERPAEGNKHKMLMDVPLFLAPLHVSSPVKRLHLKFWTKFMLWLFWYILYETIRLKENILGNVMCLFPRVRYFDLFWYFKRVMMSLTLWLTNQYF